MFIDLVPKCHNSIKMSDFEVVNWIQLLKATEQFFHQTVELHVGLGF